MAKGRPLSAAQWVAVVVASLALIAIFVSVMLPLGLSWLFWFNDRTTELTPAEARRSISFHLRELHATELSVSNFRYARGGGGMTGEGYDWMSFEMPLQQIPDFEKGVARWPEDPKNAPVELSVSNRATSTPHDNGEPNWWPTAFPSGTRTYRLSKQQDQSKLSWYEIHVFPNSTAVYIMRMRW